MRGGAEPGGKALKNSTVLTGIPMPTKKGIRISKVRVSVFSDPERTVRQYYTTCPCFIYTHGVQA